MNERAFFGSHHSELIQPAFYNWSSTIDPHIYTSQDRFKLVVVSLHDRDLSQIELFQESNKTVWEIYSAAFRTDQIIENPFLKRHPTYPFIRYLYDKNIFWKFILNLVFKPGPKIQNLIETIEKENEIASKTFKIGIHLRLGDERLGRKRSEDFQWTPPHWVTRYPTGQSIPCFVERAIEFWSNVTQDQKKSKLYDKPVFFIMSDNRTICNITTSLLKEKGYHAFDADKYAKNITHVYIAKDSDHTRSFLDFFFFSTMDSSVITFSGFSMGPTKFKCSPTLMYFKEDKNTKRCMNFFDYTATGLCHSDWINN